MRKLLAVLNFIDAMNDWVGRVLWFGIILMTLLVLSEVTRRYVFNAPTVWGNELTQLIFAVYVVLSGGYVLRWGAHVNVDILYSHFSTRNKAYVDIVTSFLFFLFCGMMLIYGGSLAWESISIWERSNSAWRPPLYPFKMMIPLGAMLLLLQGAAKLVRDILTAAGLSSEMTGERGEIHEH
ncbi:MAG: TRAP transporter small permease subunit [Deltaproteobacteria bacterium]|nr:TRAP transporter small permease subunit [Deltaproteobacteria bacterium]